jgi:hypothetical protein
MEMLNLLGFAPCSNVHREVEGLHLPWSDSGLDSR